MSDAVIAAIVASVPASIAAGAALVSARRSGRTNRDMQTNHGLRAGEYLELAAAYLNDLRAQLAEHTAQDEANFQTIARKLDEWPG